MLQSLLSHSSKGPHLTPPQLSLLMWQGLVPTVWHIWLSLPTHCTETAPLGLDSSKHGAYGRQ